MPWRRKKQFVAGRPIVLEAPLAGERFLKMLRTARSVAGASENPVKILWLFRSTHERNAAASYLLNQFERRLELEVEVPTSSTLGLLMAYKVTPESLCGVEGAPPDIP